VCAQCGSGRHIRISPGRRRGGLWICGAAKGKKSTSAYPIHTFQLAYIAVPLKGSVVDGNRA